VALNCVANGRLVREGPFDAVWAQPASGDAGGALGVALAVWHRYLDQPRSSPERTRQWVPARTWSGDDLPPYADGMKGAYLGPHFSSETICRFLDARGLPRRETDPAAVLDAVADLLADGKIVGLHQGRMEFGPRALGGRSILGDPRSPKMQSMMNLKIKHRESFRPFAPSVLREEVGHWFGLEDDSPYMLIVAGVAPERRRDMTEAEESLWGIEKLNVLRSEIPAVTHVDYSARIQTVRRDVAPFYWATIDAFRGKTGCPVVVNASFNVRGEPIVCTPEDAYRCFMRTEIDALVLEDCILDKSAQLPFEDDENWREEFQLD